MKKKILIIGGTGFIGFHLINLLKKKKYEIVSVSKNRLTKKRVQNIKYIFFDFTKRKNFEALDKYKFDIVINLGGNVDHFNKKSTISSQFISVKNLIDYFKYKKIKIFIQIGSCAEYGVSVSPQKEENNCKPKLIYAKTKLRATKYVQKFFKKKLINGIILRLYQVYGPHQSSNRFIPIIVKKCLMDKTYDCHNRGVYRDFLYIDDFLKLLIKIFNKKNLDQISGKIYNVGYGKPLDLNLVAKKIKKLCKGGSQSKKKVKLRLDEPKVIYPNTRLVKKVFNWKPNTKFEIGLKKTINFYKNA